MIVAQVLPALLRPAAHRIATVAAAVSATAATLLIAPAGLPTAAADPCPTVEVVFARGTSEAPGIGRVGQALVDNLQGQVGSVGVYAVNYPATYDFLAAADGAVDATNHISAMAAQCPNTRIVLGGYSQGAAVIDMLVGIPPLGNKVGEVGSAPPLPGNLVGNVAAVAVFGNPSAKFSRPVTSGNLGGRSIDLCNDGDPICSDGRNPFAHTSYESTPYPAQAAGFIAGLV
ncbi:MAG: cutinase family protein [Mycobacterium sp.]|nr:cutinase family protein [Mycobacterium sp.]